MKEIQVTDADGGIRLDRWFRRHLPAIPHAMLEKHLRKGQVRLDGKKAKSSDRVEAGQQLRFPAALESQTADTRPRLRREITPEESKDMQRLVLYRDAELIVINKPAGLAVQGGSKLETHLDAMLEALRFDADENPRLVHRLDKDTSGCLMLARSARAAARLTRQFAARDVEKVYLALVRGLPLPMRGTISLPLAKAGSNYEKMEVNEEEGRPAVTEYQVLEHLSDTLSWVELKPVTGRTHQLRVHMASIGHPIIGDGKYGGAAAFVEGSVDLPRQLHLHAARIVMPGAGGKKLDVKAPLPPHMKQSRKLLGLD